MMISEKEIRKDALGHIWQTIIPIALLQAVILFFGEKIFGIVQLSTVVNATSVAFCFSLVEIFAVSLVWNLVAAKHKDSLPSFLTFCPAFRILLALFVLMFVYMSVGRDNMFPYIVAFIVYYFVLLISHTLFFKRETKKLFDN